MLQQVIVAVIGVAVAIYVVYRIMRIIRGKSSACHCGCGGCKSSSCCCDEKSFREKIQRKKHKVLAESEFLPIFASQKDKVPWPSG